MYIGEIILYYIFSINLLINLNKTNKWVEINFLGCSEWHILIIFCNFEHYVY